MYPKSQSVLPTFCGSSVQSISVQLLSSLYGASVCGTQLYIMHTFRVWRGTRHCKGDYEKYCFNKMTVVFSCRVKKVCSNLIEIVDTIQSDKSNSHGSNFGLQIVLGNFKSFGVNLCVDNLTLSDTGRGAQCTKTNQKNIFAAHSALQSV